MRKSRVIGFLFFIGFISCLISCENFLNSSSLKEQIEKDIAYANAESFTVRVASDNGTGTIVTGAGDKTVKVSDPINLEFDVSDSYKFLSWTAIDRDSGVELPDTVEFTPKNKEVTVAKILKEGNILIKPVCVIRPAVVDFLPRDNYSGEPKNSTILITFNHELSLENDLSKISVSINGDSILQHFQKPEIDGKSIKILPDNKNPLTSFDGTKIVTVRVPADFFYIHSDGTKISLGENSSDGFAISYHINNETNEKTKVRFQAPVTEAGIMIPTTGSDSYSLGRTINLNFNETREYKFCGWNIENGAEVVEIVNAESPDTILRVIEASTSEVTVSPKVYKRPAILSFAPDTGNQAVTTSVPKDSDIRITFDHELSRDNDFSGISITISGDDVSECFEKPVLDEQERKIITINAKIDNSVLVTSGTKTVNVRIPANLYYETEDGYKIEAGTEEILRKYSINANSKIQVKVDFSMTADSGTLSKTGTETYNYNDEVQINFTENDAYQFLRWELQNDKTEDGTVIASLSDAKSAKTTLKIKGKTAENKNVLVKAVCEKRPSVTVFSPVVPVGKTSVAKNSSISIMFSNKLELSEAELEKIKITIGDESVKEHFKPGKISGDAVIYEANNENLIDLKSGEKTVKVTIPGDFYYLANKTEEYAGDKIFIGKAIENQYVINSETEVRPSVAFKTVSESGGSVEAGTIIPGGKQKYNYGDQINLSFTENEKYQFLRWEASEADKILIENTEKAETTAKVKSTDGSKEYEVRAVCAERPVISSFTPDTKSTSSSVAKNSSIIITFSNKLELADEDLERIQITSGGDNIKRYFKKPEVHDASVIFEAENELLIPFDKGNENKIVTVTVPGDFYYLNAGGTKVSIGKEIKKEYEINSKTTVTPSVTFSLVKAESGAITPSGTKEYNYGDSVPLSFTENSKYKFLGWESSDPEKIQIENLVSAATSVKIKSSEQGSFTVTAVCAERPVVSSFAPDTTASNSESVPKDRDIEITFSRPLLPSTDLSKINVYMGQFNADEYFADRVLERDGLKVVLKADINNPLPVSSGTAVITVLIPSEYSYLYQDDTRNVNIDMGAPVSKTYRVNSKSKNQTTLSFNADTLEGTIVPSGQQTYNYGDRISLKFAEKPGYAFLRWETNATEGIEIGDEKSAETTVTVKLTEETSGLYIKPVCVERPSVERFSPTMANSGVPKDSDIEIEFNKPLAAENDLSKITVFMDGYSVDEYFEDRNINGNIVTLKANMNKPLPVTNGIKTVVVTVPEEFYYKDGEDIESLKITLASRIEKTYKINSTTINKAEISFIGTNAQGDMSVTGDKTLYMFDEMTVSFVPKNEYELTGWSVQFENNSDVPDSILSQIVSQNNTNLTVKLLSGIENQKIIIKPICKLKPKLFVHFLTEHGSTVPNEDRTYYSNDKFNIRYEENPDYAFTGWKIFRNGIALNSLDNENSPLKFDSNEQKNTDVTVKNLEEDVHITLVAECSKRPKVVSYSPTLATGSVQRDRTIVVMFDKKMSVDSIYFTDKELFQAGVFRESGSGYELNNEEYILWQTGNDGDSNRKIYGYCKKYDSDGSSYVYKNIRITRRDNDSINLLKYYGEPAFDKNDTSTLRIPTKISDTDSSGNVISNGKDEAPPKNIGILVSLGASMNYKTEENHDVSLSSEVSWPYLTNRYTDAAPPAFDNSSIFIVKCASNATGYVSDDDVDFKKYYYTDNTDDASLIGEGKNVCITGDVSRIKTFNVDTGHLWIKGSVSDDGSGVESVTGYFVKKNDPYYPNNNDQDEKVQQVITFELNNGSSTDVKEIDQKVNLAEFGLDEGVYTLSFTATDANGHKTDSDCSYQFVYDVKKPDVKKLDFHRGSADKGKFLWKNSFASDFAKVEIKTKNETEAAADITNTFVSNQVSPVSGNQDGYQVEISSLTDGTNYSHTLVFYDLAGNETTIPVAKDTSAPAKISNFSRTRNTSGKTEFSWTTPSVEDFSKIKIKYQIDEEGSEDAEQEELYAKDVNSKVLTGLADYKHYKYTATVMDYAGNESAPVVIKDDTEAPSAIVKTTISNTRTSAANETIKWTNPTASDFGKTIIEIYDGETLKKSYDVSKGTESQLFDGLEDRKRYTYKLRTVDYSGNESAVTEWEDIVGPSTSSLVTKSTIKNVRTSADKETLSWTEPTALENSYFILEQYSPSGALVSSKEVTRSESSKLFENMTRGKYKYRFYSVDYANNKSSKYTEWQDDVLPTAVVSNISNYRPSATYETISWTNPTGAVFDDVDYMKIEQYDGTSLKNSYTWTPSSPATSRQFTGMSRGKYTYKFSCVDYAGNKIATTTDWQDNEGPGPVTDVYGGGKKNYKVHLYFDTPDTDELSHVEIYKGTTKESIAVKKLDCVASTLTTVDQKGKHYEVQPGSNAGTNTQYVIKAFDYAGNASEVRISEGYAQPGMICHDNTTKNEVFVSLNVYKNQNPVGVLYTVDEYLNTWGSSGRKVNLVYDMNEYSDQYFWGQDNGDPKNGDGKKFNGWDDYVNFTDPVNHLNLYNKTVNCFSAYNRKGQTSYTIWNQLYFNVNKKNTDKNNKVIWYVPAIDQFDTIISKRSSIDIGFDKLRAAGYNPVLQTEGKRLGASSTTSDGDKYFCLTSGSLKNKNFDYSRQDRDNVGTSNWHCIAEINLD